MNLIVAAATAVAAPAEGSDQGPQLGKTAESKCAKHASATAALFLFSPSYPRLPGSPRLMRRHSAFITS